jgi:histidine triad (HIT) family protein
VSTSCPFCRIVAGGAPADVLHETDTVVAFRDLRPQAPAHILLIPKEHIEDLTEIGDKHGTVLVDIVKAAAHLAETEGIHESGWRLVANVGPDAGQSVFHLHFHLLGGRPMGWPPG